jgi:hypothetical protein
MVPLLIRGPLINLPVVLATDFPPIQVVCIAMILTTMMVLWLIFISHLSLVWGSWWSCILLPASRAFLFPPPEKAYTCQAYLYQTYHTHNNLNQTCLHQIYLMFMTLTTLVVVVVVVVVVVIRS